MSHYPFYEKRNNIILPASWEFSFNRNQDIDAFDPAAQVFTDHLTLPGCFDAMEQFAGAKGTGCYKSSFRLDHAAKLRLHIGGMGLYCRIYCDGREIGRSNMPFTPLNFDFQADAGVHTLMIAINNICNEAKAPQFQLSVDFYAFGGIYYSFYLMEMPDFYIDRAYISMIDPAAGKIGVTLQFGGDVPAETDVRYSFDNAAEEKTFHCNIQDGKAYMEAVVPDPTLWTPDAPVLHTLHCEIEGDSITERFGLRSIEVKGREILLNGEPLKLFGFNRHEHHPDFGAALPGVIHLNDLMLIKKTGANFVRGSHYPQHQGFLDLCDELGILVWEEGLAWGKQTPEGMCDPLFIQSQLDNVRAMIGESRNHPSIIMWGYLNECNSFDEEPAKLYKSLTDMIHQLDPQRPVTFALLGRKDHIVFEYADIVSMNLYPGWYDTEEEEIRTIHLIEPVIKDYMAYLDNTPAAKDKPFIISEIGAAALYGNKDRFRARWTEGYQADHLEEVIRIVGENTRINGVALWMFSDTRTGMQGRVLRRPRGYNNKGVFDEHRNPKEAVCVVTQGFKKYLNKER